MVVHLLLFPLTTTHPRPSHSHPIALTTQVHLPFTNNLVYLHSIISKGGKSNGTR